MQTTHAAPEIETTLRLLDGVFPHGTLERVGFKLWDDTRWPDEHPRAATLVLKDPSAVRAIFAATSEKALAEAFVAEHFDVEGDLEAACELADALDGSVTGDWRLTARRFFALRHVHSLPDGRARPGHGVFGPRRHSRARDRSAIAFHYDVSNEFFQLWLDPRMLYSCAYFERGDETLELAQRAKLEHICRKLRLRPGLRLLDIGCGWGGLAIHAAQNFGVTVTGVTLSEAQAALAMKRVADAGLSSRVEILLQDYRDLDDRSGFDAIASVGMAEHVGAEQLRAYFEKAYRLLKPGGVFLNHAIGEGVRARPARGGSFIQEYVFPDSDLQRIPFVLTAAEAAGFEVRDVENLREHYRLTLRHWVQRLENSHRAARQHVSEATYRIWRLYMAGSAYGFQRGRLAIYQSLLSKPDDRGDAHLPLTRRDWYDSH